MSSRERNKNDSNKKLSLMQKTHKKLEKRKINQAQRKRKAKVRIKRQILTQRISENSGNNTKKRKPTVHLNKRSKHKRKNSRKLKRQRRKLKSQPKLLKKLKRVVVRQTHRPKVQERKKAK